MCSNYRFLGVVELDGSFAILNSLSAKKKDTIIENMPSFEKYYDSLPQYYGRLRQ
jgi:hypothetical protein